MPDQSSIPSWTEYGYHAMREMERFSAILEKAVDEIATIKRWQSATDAKTKLMGSVYGFGAAALVEAGRILVSLFTSKH